MRAGYERLAGLDEVFRRARQLAVRTIIFDIEPLVAYWDSDQAALDRGVARVLSQTETVPSVQVLCFATNSVRRPAGLSQNAGVRVVYLASASKPLRIASYRSFPRPGMVIGDQIATDGILARRLDYVFVQYRPPSGRLPAGPWLMDRLGRLVRPLLFTQPG
jgi:predicted HAD superfamily phosphohydrolase YqeG